MGRQGGMRLEQWYRVDFPVSRFDKEVSVIFGKRKDRKEGGGE